jgi:hypothetical protein
LLGKRNMSVIDNTTGMSQLKIKEISWAHCHFIMKYGIEDSGLLG